MATQKEIAKFFQLALRLELVDTVAVEQWVDSVISAEASIQFPFTDVASRLSANKVDELLGQVAGHFDPYIPGRIVLALLRRHFHEGKITPEATIRRARDIAFANPLTEKEYYEADRLDDALSLATRGTYGTLDDVRREIAEFLEDYAGYDGQAPAIA